VQDNKNKNKNNKRGRPKYYDSVLPVDVKPPAEVIIS
jgi:hypothetical protein